ncbi:MAG: hypothetical protein AAB538_01185, partial [Patescibacteria group bacterium]
MRDIRPVPKKPPLGGMPLPSEDELYEVSQSAKQRGSERASVPSKALRGSQVPVTNVHVPAEPSRPLFAKAPLREKKPKTRIRLGSKERAAVLVLLLIVVVVVLLSAAIFLPRADVKLILRTAPLLVDEDLIVRAAADGPNVIPGA